MIMFKNVRSLEPKIKAYTKQEVIDEYKGIKLFILEEINNDFRYVADL